MRCSESESAARKRNHYHNYGQDWSPRSTSQYKYSECSPNPESTAGQNSFVEVLLLYSSSLAPGRHAPDHFRP